MNTKLSLFKFRQRAYRFIEIGIYPFIAFMFSVLLVWQVYSIIEAHSQLKTEMESRDVLSKKLAKYRENAKISDQDRLVYGTIIKKQIPLNNNAFDIYALMESFYETTGIELKDFTSNSIGNKSTGSTVSKGTSSLLGATAKLTPQALSEVIDTYQYQFSRFMTLNEITVTKLKEVQGEFYDVKFSFQTYSLNEDKKTTNETQNTLAQFTVEDRNNFEHYVNNTNIDLYYATQSAPPTDEEYETSETLF